MEQQTFMIKNFSRIANPDIHLRRIAYPSEREVMADYKTDHFRTHLIFSGNELNSKNKKQKVTRM